MTLIARQMLETSRLYLLPLDYDQLHMYLDNDGQLESFLGLTNRDRILDIELVDTVQKFIVPYIFQYPAQILYATLWILILKRESLIVGDISFKGAPSEKGLLEVGYTTDPSFRNMGLMSEALKIFSDWAFSNSDVELILAETAKENWPSQRILKKNRFELFAETDCMFWWRLDRLP